MSFFFRDVNDIQARQRSPEQFAFSNQLGEPRAILIAVRALQIDNLTEANEFSLSGAVHFLARERES